MKRIVASIEARMGSSRLPGKALADIGGKPALSRLLSRLRQCSTLSDIVLATTVNPEDDALEGWAAQEGITCYRGSEEDVLDRVVQAHRMMHTDVVVELTGDCPLLDAEVIDLGVDTFLSNSCDVVSNTRIPSWPQGADVQVFRVEALAHVASISSDPAVREHVSLYFYEHPSLYRLIHLVAPRSLQAPDLRLQIDYPEDLEFIREVYAHLGVEQYFSLSQILELLREKPHIARINSECQEKPIR